MIIVNTPYSIGRKYASNKEFCGYAGFYEVSIFGINGVQKGTDTQFMFHDIKPDTYNVSVSMSCKFKDKNSCDNCRINSTQHKNVSVTVKSDENATVKVAFFPSRY